MPINKQIIIIAMVLIVAAVGLIFFIGGKDESTTEIRLEEAKTYYDMMDYDKAIAIYNNILKSEKNCTEAYVGLANSYIAKGNDEKAVEILERGISNAGNDPMISDMLSEISGGANTAKDEENVSAPEIFDETTVSESSREEETTSVPEISEPEPETSAPETELDEEVSETTEKTTTTTEKTTASSKATTTERPKQTQAPARPAVTSATTVSTAKPDIEMPNFIGMDKNEAVKLAAEKNIKLSLQYDKNDMYANDVVYYQSHRAGTMVSKDTDVEVYVCVNDKKQVTEDDIKAESFYNAAKQWGDNNSDKVKSVSFNADSRTVTINAVSVKNFVIDESVASAFAECKNAVMVINSSSMTMVISSSSVTKSGKLDLSANAYGNDSRLTLDMGASGSLNCTATVTVFDCDIRSKDLKDMKLYYNNKKSGSFKVDIDGNPIITVSSGGQYTIR